MDIADNWLTISDYKTNKVIKREGFKSWNGDTKKMLYPVQHLDDCELMHYTLQMSLYAFLILRRNPHLKLRSLTIKHVTFEILSEDKYGFPEIKIDPVNEYPVVKSEDDIEVPYLRNEVIAIIKQHLSKAS
jgi:hypothetical protein